MTLDGPAGSGKSTTAREVARRLGYRHLDSGALYRALTWALLERGVLPERWEELAPEDLDACRIGVDITPRSVRPTHRDEPLEDAWLRTPAVTENVSRLATLPVVRSWLLGLQREAGRRGRLVADGRDMGTVVFPDAEVKIFLTADLRERASRRLRERGGEDPGPAEVDLEKERIRDRDRRDSEREISPLRRPPDAVVLDTTRLDFEAQVEAVLERVRRLTREG